MTVSCPACKGSQCEPEIAVTADQAAQHFVLREADAARHAELAEHISILWSDGEARLCRCHECGFGFAWPFVGGDEQFYALAYGASGYPRERWEFDRTLQAIKGSSYANALEVGAGRGFFLDRLSPASVPPAGVMALEYNADARAIMTAKGYRVAADDFRTLATDERFAIICMFQVLEHLDAPDKAFGAIARLLAPGGRAFLSVPNDAVTVWSHRNGGLLDMPPNHIGRWTPEAFRIVAERNGLKVVACEQAPGETIHFVGTDLISSFLRRAQKSGTLANWLAAKGRRGKRLGAMLYAPLRFPRSLAGSFRKEGPCLWVELGHQSEP